MNSIYNIPGPFLYQDDNNVVGYELVAGKRDSLSNAAREVFIKRFGDDVFSSLFEGNGSQDKTPAEKLVTMLNSDNFRTFVRGSLTLDQKNALCVFLVAYFIGCAQPGEQILVRRDHNSPTNSFDFSLTGSGSIRKEKMEAQTSEYFTLIRLSSSETGASKIDGVAIPGPSKSERAYTKQYATLTLDDLWRLGNDIINLAYNNCPESPTFFYVNGSRVNTEI